jgi:hypothetical protein
MLPTIQELKADLGVQKALAVDGAVGRGAQQPAREHTGFRHGR